MLGRKPSTTITHTRNRFQPILELLEDRLAPATFTVNSTLDTDDGLALNATTTLRKAIRLANGDAVADTVNFAAALTNQTITLGGTQLPTITKPVTITGLGADKLTIDANDASRIFNINDDTDAKIAVSIAGLRLTRGKADFGSAIYNTEVLTLAASRLDHNAATDSGGGVFNKGSLTLTNSTLSANSAVYGGGIFIKSGTVMVTNSMLSANSAGNGGGIFMESGTVTVTNSTLSANSADYGGGINNDGALTVTNSTLSANSASVQGGGIYNDATPLTLTNSTVVKNRATSDGGGIFTTSYGSTELFNTIVAGNVQGSGSGTPNDLASENVDAAGAFNPIGDPHSRGGLTNGTSGNIIGKKNGNQLLPLAEILDPTLRNNGGPTHTHALIRYSPAVSAGDNTKVAAIPLDQRGPGFNRIVAGQVDIGAFEMPRPLFTDNFQRAPGSVVENSAGVLTTLAATDILSATDKANLRFLVTGSNLRFFVNDTLVANVFDTSLSSGSVGIRADANATLDDFHAAAVTTNLPFADNFDLPDGAGLGGNWTRRAGDFQVQGNKAVGVNPGPAVNLATLVGVNQANVEVQADVALVTTGHEIGLLACQSGTTDANYYLARVLKTAAGFTLSIVRNIGGTVTPLTSINVATLTGPIKFRIEGVSLKLFMNNVQQLSTTDSSLAAGSVGIRSIGTGTIDNFTATSVNFLPFNDSFNADTLNGNWVLRAGGYTTTAALDQAKGTTTQNLMALQRFDAADVDLQADINVGAVAGQYAGLVARYSGPAANSMYLATVSYTGTQYVASIQKRVGSVTTTPTSLIVGTGVGTLRFTAIGGQLKLYFEGWERLTKEDFTLHTGSVGIRSSLNPTFDNFSVKQAS